MKNHNKIFNRIMKIENKLCRSRAFMAFSQQVIAQFRIIITNPHISEKMVRIELIKICGNNEKYSTFVNGMMLSIYKK